MSFLFDIVGSLGLGSQLTLAATLLVVAFYALRMVSGARTVGTILSSGIAYVVAVFVAGAAAIALGWVDPSVGTASDHVSTAVNVLWDLTGGIVIDLIEEAIP
jgi:uncharacterized membrane protein SpoIIM required for sporulation